MKYIFPFYESVDYLLIQTLTMLNLGGNQLGKQGAQELAEVLLLNKVKHQKLSI